jgi:putative restriction endonuclease
MRRKELIDIVDNLSIWRRGDSRAPHKPLLILLMLARLQKGDISPIAYKDLDPQLSSLLIAFGPSRKSYHTSYPFWRLKNDGIWTLFNEQEAISRISNTDPPKSELLKHNVLGGFSSPVLDLLTKSPLLIVQVTSRLLHEHFPESIHSVIIEKIGINMNSYVNKRVRKRDKSFSGIICKIYGNACAVCGFDVNFLGLSIGIEAAHIKWHSEGGPDIESNGLALCSLHHTAFDLGAFSVNEHGAILISSHMNNMNDANGHFLLKYNGNSLRLPISTECKPKQEFLAWHRSEVFKL